VVIDGYRSGNQWIGGCNS